MYLTGTPQGTQTPNLLVRSQVLYSIELTAYIGSDREIRTPDNLRMKEVFYHLNYITMEAGDRFELPLHLAYETGVVTALPAIKMVSVGRIELPTHGPKPRILPLNYTERKQQDTLLFSNKKFLSC